MKALTSKEIRKSFLDFFAQKGHIVVPSAPLVIKEDPTLMFTNAGMNQFKNIILGNDPVKQKRLCDVQKCLRVSGKHNDLEEVGHDTYHHTMFEMLGNWSFGDYFKQEAIDYAWEFLVGVLAIDPNDLYVTVFEGSKEEGLEVDDEAKGFWLKHLPEDHILYGNKHDNFWEMGETGPCGPCSEIHIDSRSDAEKAKISGRELVNKDNPQVIEIWNIVFMQFNRLKDGSLQPLAMKVIDTGMGFERLVRTLQGKNSNYDTDIFQPMLQRIASVCSLSSSKPIAYGKDEKTDIAMRVIADHIRTIGFSIAESQLPSNNKAGYVIRRILRRAVRYGYTFLEQRQAFLYLLVPQLLQDLGDVYPELKQQEQLITKVIKEEEETFLKTLDKGISLLDELMKKYADTKVIPGKDVFVLYDTFGFPLDLTELILRENNYSCDEDEFQEQMQQQKERARNATHQEIGDWQVISEGASEFVGYDTLVTDSKVLRYRKINQAGKEAYQIVLDKTPFYAEMGGEIGDTGTLGDVAVFDTKKENNLTLHYVETLPSNIEGTLKAEVDVKKRQAIACNHTATHLLHLALREVLGNHVEQKGSFVTEKSLRFDFSHFQKVTPEELRKVEIRVNELIRENFQREEKRDLAIEEARKMGAMALFGEKYGDKVRVIKYGDSVELCGGCHVAYTGNIGSFRIVYETSVAAGIRRIEAITATKVDEAFYEQVDTINELRSWFNNTPDLRKAVQKFIEENFKLKKEVEQFFSEKAEKLKDFMLNTAQDYKDIKLVKFDGAYSPEEIKAAFSSLNKKTNDVKLAVVGATIYNNIPTISVFFSKPLVDSGKNAGKVVKEKAQHIQGGGGGPAWMATASGKDASGLNQAMTEIIEEL
ncbi:MAG: alanine--tRNA ligase [Paludibacteraceae bacterium]|nr:alanine--tRNA ligase [Paludibacteraceae bacterium]